MTHSVSLEHVQTPTLNIAYEASGLFSGPHERVVVPGAGHNLPQEKPATGVEAVLQRVDR